MLSSLHRSIAACMLGALASGAVGCAQPAARVRHSPSPVAASKSAAMPGTEVRAASRSIAFEWPHVGELDPLGALVDAGDAIGLSRDQSRLVRERRRLLRDATRPQLARLDSLNFALDGRLDAWLAAGRGAELSARARAWVPKLLPEPHAVATALVACVRHESRAALRDVEEWLDAAQRERLAELARRDVALRALVDGMRGAWNGARDSCPSTTAAPTA